MKITRFSLSAWALALWFTPLMALPKPGKIWEKDYRHMRMPINQIPKRALVGTAHCTETSAFTTLEAKENIFNGLSNAEVADVAAWLFAQADLNLTATENATEWDNTVALIELLQPNKTETLLYLDHGASPPLRFAHVVLSVSSVEEPYYAEIQVGPLPVQNATIGWNPLQYPLTKKTGGRVRNLDADFDTLYTEWLNPIAFSVADITENLFNASYTGSLNDTAIVHGIDPLWQEDGRIVRWDQFSRLPTSGFQTHTLMPLGLYFRSDVTGRDPSQWKLEGWLYNGIFYETTEDFRKAWETPDFEKIPMNTDGPWGSTDHIGPIFPLDIYEPPMSVAPSGARFRVDREKNFVQWMGFELYLSFHRDTGLRLHDITYKGERVVFELGLQEALAHYAANDPFQSSTAYLDSFYGFGPFSFELVDGYDCPSYSTYLNTSYYAYETTRTHINSICLFERDASYPLQRHSTGRDISVTKNIVFTIRNICVIGNYDYMFSYEFYMDGTINVDVRASGYIQSTNAAKNHDYGYRITNESLSGSMHDHVLNFKLDIDVLGTENSVEITRIVPSTETYPWSSRPRNTMKLQRSLVETEDDGKLLWGFNGATQYNVINKDKPNSFGEYRGYRIAQSAGTAHLAVVDSTNLANAANWATHDLMVTAHHDTEPRSAHPYNNQDVFDPPVDFDKFFDGENLVQNDLVLWFNLGMHHIPHTGDLPNTVFSTAHSGISISPHNYLTGDPSRETVQMVRISYGDGEPATVNSFGKEPAVCAVEVGSSEEDLQSYLGDVVIRKYPYDPSDPWFETGYIGK